MQRATLLDWLRRSDGNGIWLPLFERRWRTPSRGWLVSFEAWRGSSTMGEEVEEGEGGGEYGVQWEDG